MGSNTNRRAVLSAVLAAGAAASIPVAAASVTPGIHPDADLFVLIDRAKIAESIADDAANAAHDIRSEKEPSFPQTLRWTDKDTPHWIRVSPSERIADHDIKWLRDWLSWDLKFDLTGLDVPLIFPTPSFIERAREIISATDEYDAAYRAVDGYPDVIQAEDRYELLRGQWEELAKQIATTPAKTLEGLAAKLALIGSAYTEEDLDGTYDGILASAALDGSSLVKTRGAEART